MIAQTEPAVIDHFAAPWVEKSRFELRPDARRFENWENAYALRAGLGAAMRYAMDIGMDRIEARAGKLADQLRLGLRQIEGVALQDAGDTHCAIVSFTMDAAEPSAVVDFVRKNGITIGASAPNSTLLDAKARNLPVLLRAAPHYYNTEAEIDALLESLKSYCQATS